MRIDELLLLGPEEAAKQIEREFESRDVDVWRDQYAGEHDILSKPDKEVGEGENKKTIVLNKLVVMFQKIIVERAIAFLLGSAPTITRKSDDDTQGAFEKVEDTLEDSKIETFNRALARDLFVETRVAELWYVRKDTPTSPAKIRPMLLSERTGNSIAPHFDDTGDMDAFVRGYSRKVTGNRTEQVTELYTADKVYTIVRASGLSVVTEIKNLFNKIPVIYYEQTEPEWSGVQSLIDRFEEVISSHADTNDYFSSPMVKLYGNVASLPDKASTGKLLRFTGQAGIDGKMDYGDAEYLTWDQSPESTKLEMDNLRMLIYSLTSTPDISFDSVKGIGNVSGIVLKLLFLDALLKAKNKEEVFGAAFERRHNILKAILSVTDVVLKPQLDRLKVNVKFNASLPQNEAEIIGMLVEARGGEPVISAETAVRNAPFVTDPEAELESIQSEAKTANTLAGTFTP